MDAKGILYTQPQPLKLLCESGAATETSPSFGLLNRKQTQPGQLVRWEMEICELEWLDMRGIRPRRLVGDIWDYKKKITNLMNDVNHSAATSGSKVKVL